MGKDKKAKAPVTLGIGGLAGAIGAYSSSPATGPSLLSAVLGDSSLDGETQVLLKKLGKRDTTTKLKALVELHATLRDKGAEWAAEFLPHWCLAFGRLAADISWQVREQACSALGVVAALLGLHHLGQPGGKGRHLQAGGGHGLCKINFFPLKRSLTNPTNPTQQTQKNNST